MTDDRPPDELRHLVKRFGAELDQIAATMRDASEQLEQLAKQMQRGGSPAEGSIGSLCPACGKPFQKGDQICISVVHGKVIHVACSGREADHQAAPPRKDGE